MINKHIIEMVNQWLTHEIRQNKWDDNMAMTLCTMIMSWACIFIIK